MIRSIQDIAKSLIWRIFFIACFIGINTINAYADRGPKPAIHLTVVNPPKGSYVAGFLCDDSSEDDTEFDAISASNNGIFETINYADAHGYIKGFVWPKGEHDGETSSLKCDDFYGASDSKPDHKYYHTYFAPDSFRVILVTEDGNVHISNHVGSGEMVKICEYDLATNKAEIKYSKHSVSFCYAVICFLITLVLEFIVFLLFRYPCTWENLSWLLTVNVLTNPILSVCLMSMARIGPGTDVMFGCWFFGEIVIVIVEGVVYRKVLKNSSGKTDADNRSGLAGRAVLYAITANMVSAIAGGFVLDIIMPFVSEFIL